MMQAQLICGCKGDPVTGQYFFCPEHKKLMVINSNQPESEIAEIQINELIKKINRLAG